MGNAYCSFGIYKTILIERFTCNIRDILVNHFVYKQIGKMVRIITMTIIETCNENLHLRYYTMLHLQQLQHLIIFELLLYFHL